MLTQLRNMAFRGRINPRVKSDQRYRACAKFRRSEHAVAAMEFAFVAPILITLFLGCYELNNYITTQRRITYLASSIAEIMSQNTTGYIDWTDILSALDSTMVTFPGVLQDSHTKGINWWSDINVNMASIAFTPTVASCTSGCTYNATAAWVYGQPTSWRSCGVNFTPSANNATPTPTTLPSDVFTAGSIIAVDISYTYSPLVDSALFGSFTIQRSFFIQPRFVSLIKMNNWNGIGSPCAGYYP